MSRGVELGGYLDVWCAAGHAWRGGLRLLHTGQMDNRDPAVEKWFETYDNPQKALVQGVRQVILNVDLRISETIKWNAPTFMLRGNIASFYPRSTKHVSLMFHTWRRPSRPDRIAGRRWGDLPRGAVPR
jgi:hypothetical protein